MLSRHLLNMEMSCSQIELPYSALKCLKTCPKPRQLEVGCTKSLDFTLKNRYFAGQFWIWSLRAPLMRLVPKVDFFQVLLDRVEPNLPNPPWKLGYRKKGLSPSFFQMNFPRSSIPNDFQLPSLITMTVYQWWAREVIWKDYFQIIFTSHAHHFMIISYENWWAWEVRYIVIDERGKYFL